MKPVPGYEGLYAAGEDGVVYSLDRIACNGRFYPGRALAPGWRHGYGSVQLCRDGIVDMRPIHRIVALTYHGPCPAGMQVRHLDGNRANNVPSNLAYGTGKENCADRVLHGTAPRGERSARAKYSTGTVALLKDFIAEKAASYRQIAEFVGVKYYYVKMLATGRRRTHG